MSKPLQGKRVVITGASSGIGRAAALEFARRGAHLVIAARRAEHLDLVAAQCRALSVECTSVVTDVTDRQACKRLIERAGVVDILVNNAGFGIFAPVATTSPEDLDAMMRTNFFGMIHCTQAVLPQMLERRSGTIVNVTSIAGIMGYAGMGGYCATKFAMIGITEALRDEVMRHGVRVAMVCPGTTDTEFFVHAEHAKMPAAARIIGALDAGRVANAICDSAVDASYRRILPVRAAVYMKLKEIFPRFAHLLMRRVSALLE